MCGAYCSHRCRADSAEGTPWWTVRETSFVDVDGSDGKVGWWMVRETSCAEVDGTDGSKGGTSSGGFESLQAKDGLRKVEV